MKILNTAMKLGLVYNQIAGPWPCEQCKQMTQFAELKGDHNHIFCKNPYCRFDRYIDMKRQTIIEPDGSTWTYDPQTGKKTRVRGR